jgi:DNA-binding CsgD family transcriptional regulator
MPLTLPGPVSSQTAYPPPVAQFVKGIILNAEELSAFGSLHGLTDRELEIMHLTMQGLDRKSMASRLGLSPHTIDLHCDQLHKKLGVHHVAELMGLVFRFVMERRGRGGT